MVSPNLQERVATKFKEEADKIAQRIADRIGQPSDSQSISTAEEVRLWNERANADPEQLLKSGMPIDQIIDAVFPNRRKMVMQGRPNPKDQVQFAEKMKALAEDPQYKDAPLPEIDNFIPNNQLDVSPAISAGTQGPI